jgi:hypothetical protein
VTHSTSKKRPTAELIEFKSNQMIKKISKKLTDPHADFRKQRSTDAKAYPTMEAVPKFRQSARGEFC